jgi:hypothetical protein
MTSHKIGVSQIANSFFNKRTGQISLVLATISPTSRIEVLPTPSETWFQFTKWFNLFILHIKIDFKIKLDIENIAK